MSTLFVLRRSPRSVAQTELALQADEWQLAGNAHLIEEAWPQLLAAPPELLVSDLRLLDGHAQRLMRRLREQGLPTRVLLLSQCADEVLLFDTLAAGAHGYHVECARRLPLNESLRALQQGRSLMSPAIARQTLALFGVARSSLPLASSPLAARDREPVRDSLLRQCERHLLSLISHGLLATEVAQRWQMACEQVELRLGRIYQRLHQQLEALRQRGAAVADEALLQGC